MLFLHLHRICCLLFIIGLAAASHPPAPLDIRIDHHKVNTTRDLIINTPRPSFSWKLRVSDNVHDRNVQQIAYQIQLKSTRLSRGEKPFEWDSQRVISSRSIHVLYQAHVDLLPSTYYQFRVRIWLSNIDEPTQWTEWVLFRTPIFDLHDYLINKTELLWIGSTEINMNELRKEFFVPADSPIKSAIVYLCGLGYYQFYLNGENVDPSRKLDPGWTTYEKRTLVVSFDVTANITTGMNAVGVKLGNGWYSIEQHGRETYGK
ncbi:unnamed protein product [Adineta ricciae]|uniref:Bacterial alpha-L-rhamnosidase N-terminal domain-containing protein n=1 Tax=Adineta ricciae TaxID=249248 RepID=A0A815NHC8_ADIRI|nr:unnamed protein product [Adineta ricciae]CAF1572242.1 unnamed protein product [Adineta ricciae]